MDKTFGRKLRQGIGILLAAAVVFNMLPLGGLAVSASENSGTGICEHHTEHTTDCGYAEAGDCRHEHTEECYTAEGEPDCHHEHDEDCGYAKAHECTYVCEICSNEVSGEDEVKDSDAEATEENSGSTSKDDTEKCICGTLCTEDSINGDCPVCGAEDADLSRCKGEKTENSSEENKEDAEQGDTGAEDAGTNLCAHHKEHTQVCGYSRASEDGEGSPCTYECRICPIEDLIAALPRRVTEDNAETVCWQLDEILDLYRELPEEEQARLDLTLVYELQAALDETNAPMTADGHDEQQADDEASVNIGGDVSYYDTIESAWAAAHLAGSAKVTLLADATSPRMLYVESSHDIIFDGGEYTLSAGTAEYPETVFLVQGKLTIAGGRIKTTLDLDGVSTPAVAINRGTLEITGGSIEGADCGLYVQEGTARLSGGTFSGGIFSGGTSAAIMGLSDNVGSFLLNHGTANDPHYAYYQNGKPLTGVLDQKKLTGSVTVQECKHDGSVCEYQPLDGGTTHKKTCLACGTTWAAEAHTLGTDNKCEGCGTALVASVKIGSDTTYYGTIESAWTAAQGKTATLTLLNDVTATTCLEMNSDSDITFNGGNCTLVGYPGDSAIIVYKGKLTIASGRVKAMVGNYGSNPPSVMVVSSGTLVVTGGTLEGGDGVTKGCGLGVIGGTVHLSGGKFIGGTIGQTGGIYASNRPLGSLLLNHDSTDPEAVRYAYFDAEDNPIALEEGKDSLHGTVTVKECKQEYTYTHTDGTTKHTLSCQYCGGTKAETDCSFTWTGAVGKCDCGTTLNVVVSGTGNLTYDDTAKKPEVTVKVDGTELNASKYEVDYKDNTNAGTASVSVSGTNWNYTQNFTIKKALLAANGTGTANGTYGAKLSELSVAGLKAVYQGTTTEVPGTWALTGSTVPGVGDAGTYTASFTPAEGAENFEPLKARVTLDIAKAAAPVPQDGTLYVQNDREQSYQYDLTQLLPTLDNGKSYGTVSYTLRESAVNISGGYYTDGAKITGTTLTLPIQKVEDNNEGNIGTVSITITSRNYEDMTAAINVTSVNKTPVTITGVSVEEREYNGEAASYTGTPGAVESGGDTATISSKDYRYTWKKADGTVLNEAPKNAGSYLLIVSVDNDAYIGSRTISFVINKAKITITADSMTADKGGAEPALTYTISGLAKGDALTTEPTLTCIVDMNTVGRYPITASGAEVPDTGNYHSEITYAPGILTVTVRTPGGGSGSSGGGNSGGSGNASDGNGSGSENNEVNGSVNTTPGVPAIPSITDTNPKTNTEAVKPGTGNTVRPRTGTGTGSSAAQEVRPDTEIPFIKGEDGKIGWNVIRAEEEKAEEGSVINVDMNGTTVVPGNIFDSIKGRDITITFDMGSGILWSVDGKRIITDKADDIDFTVRTGGSAVPAEIVNNVTGEHHSIQLSLAYDGEFGFTAVLSINLGKENAGFIASLYYYNEDTGELEFICADEVAEDGAVSIAFTHASDYVIVIDNTSKEPAPESAGNITEAPAEEEGNSGETVVSPKEIGKVQRSSTSWLILAGVAVVIFGAAGILIWKRKKEEGNREVK